MTFKGRISAYGITLFCIFDCCIIKNYDSMDKKDLIMQLFIGKVADVIGIKETTNLLKEANEAFK